MFSGGIDKQHQEHFGLIWGGLRGFFMFSWRGRGALGLFLVGAVPPLPAMVWGMMKTLVITCTVHNFSKHCAIIYPVPPNGWVFVTKWFWAHIPLWSLKVSDITFVPSKEFLDAQAMPKWRLFQYMRNPEISNLNFVNFY